MTATSAVQVVSATFQPNPSATEPTSATQPEAQNSALPALPAPESAQPGLPQTPVTVTQPPGVSGFVPVDYLLMFFGAALIAFLATRPGTHVAIKALLQLLTGGGPGNPPL
ncbi:hypothetical protein ABZV29_38465 [Streptomyces sp. NPDC005236]|uniref:hypothetical protein n=1 Tax=Streptomyces sp. NPDC005236 TaxID=3157028 RepID=UPI0033BBB401